MWSAGDPPADHDGCAAGGVEGSRPIRGRPAWPPNEWPKDPNLRGVLWATRTFTSNLNDRWSGDWRGGGVGAVAPPFHHTAVAG